jgi:hypothetical protein
MARTRKDRPYLVTRPDTHCGFSVRATSYEAAARKARRWATMADATAIVVRPIAHGDCKAPDYIQTFYFPVTPH